MNFGDGQKFSNTEIENLAVSVVQFKFTFFGHRSNSTHFVVFITLIPNT
jgi:hypothetical protein